MLLFFRKYQRFFYSIVAVVIILSFTFFGTYSAIFQSQNNQDRKVAESLDGSTIMESDVRTMSQFFSSSFGKKFFDEEIIRTGIAAMLFEKFSEKLSSVQLKFFRMRNYLPYQHPLSPMVSAQRIWERHAPDIVTILYSVKVKGPTFEDLCRLYLEEAKFPPYILQKMLLMEQSKQNISYDPFLSQGDFSLFGFHTLSDWFTDNFIDLVALYVLQGAAFASSHGIEISKEQAATEFSQEFASTTFIHEGERRMAEKLFQKLLQYLAFTKSECYFPALEEEFHAFAGQKAIIEEVLFPEVFSKATPYELAFYFKAAYGSFALDKIFSSSQKDVAEIFKESPELCYQSIELQYQHINKEEALLKIPAKELLLWQMEEKNWQKMQKAFSLKETREKSERFALLESLSKVEKKSIDEYSRKKIVEEQGLLQNSLLQSPIRNITCKINSFFSDFPYPIDISFLLSKEPSEEFYSVGNASDLLRIRLIGIGEKKLFALEESYDNKMLQKALHGYLEKQFALLKQQSPSPFSQQATFQSEKEKIASLFFHEGLSKIWQSA